MVDYIDWEETKKIVLRGPKEVADNFLSGLEADLRFNLWAVLALKKDPESLRNVSWNDFHKLILDGLEEGRNNSKSELGD